MKYESVPRRARADFEPEIPLRIPVIVTDALSSWSAREIWSLSYLRLICGNQIVPVSVYLPGGGIERVVQSEMRFRDYLDLVEDGHPPMYLQQYPIFDYFPQLRHHVRLPPGCDRSSRVSIYFWLGPAGSSSPLHYDDRDNAIAQLRGSKRFRLFAPDQGPFLYPHEGRPENRHLSRLDLEKWDLERYPGFAQAQGQHCVLGPGEVLYLPAGWWHQVRSYDLGMSLNFWW